MNRNPVGWFELYVQDINRAKAFYENVFQTSLEPLPNTELTMYMFPGGPEQSGAPGALIQMEGIPSRPGGTLIYFSCADCSEEAARAVEAGGRIEKEKFSIGDYGYIALVHDCEGNLIGLHSMQ